MLRIKSGKLALGFGWICRIFVGEKKTAWNCVSSEHSNFFLCAETRGFVVWQTITIEKT